MDRVWDTSKCYPNLSVIIFNVKIIQGHEVKKRSNCFGGVMRVLDQFSSRTQTVTQEHFVRTTVALPCQCHCWTAQIRQKLKIGKMQKSKRTSWKWAVFKYQKVRIFWIYLLKIVRNIHILGSVRSHYILFFPKLKKYIYIIKGFKMFFLSSRISKTLQILDSGLMDAFILNLLLKISQFYIER